jgi:hypothetical protein
VSSGGCAGNTDEGTGSHTSSMGGVGVVGVQKIDGGVLKRLHVPSAARKGRSCCPESRDLAPSVRPSGRPVSSF